MEDLNKITYFAETDHRGRVPFGIKAKDRSKHVYVIGKTGMGKSTLLENMAVQDIKEGNGMCFVDPHGKTADLLLEYIPEERHNDVVYFAPFDMENPISFNIMEDVGYDKRHLVANGLMSAFKKIWADQWSSRMEYILNNVILALLEYPDSTLLGINRMLTDNAYRKKVVDNITDPSTKSFWVDEFAKYTDRYTKEATPAIQNKVGQFTANPLIRNIIGQPKSSFDFREAMDKKKIVIINLSKGRIGEGNALLLGSMLITKLYLSAMSRADLDDNQLQKVPNFYLFVDEFQSFANESFADILSEARKYKLNLTIAHQYIEQMPEEVRAAVFGNVGTMVTFRVGAYDAEVLEKEFAPKFYSDDLVNLGFTQIYLKLMIDGVSSQPFSAVTLPPIKLPDVSHKDVVVQKSRELYTKPQKEVEEQISEWYKEGTPSNLSNTNNVKKLPVKQGNDLDRNAGGRQFQQKIEKQSNDSFVKKREEGLRQRVEKEVTESLSEKPWENRTKPKAQDRTRTFKKNEDKQEGVGRLSLSALKSEVVKQGAPQRSGNRDSLKSALKDVLENKSEPKEEKKESVAPEEGKKEQKKLDEASPKPETKEVPEEVLRKVLDVKGDKKE
ncbi:MAG: type IV secretion system DNA-binding domain-containing protein [Candidatus Pacebacteria bacterium]|nr:type IV secretion system DNA-binding domain-containing protein [Candidatus Paceibacterota bacterium]